jgi:hypothetical protein
MSCTSIDDNLEELVVSSSTCVSSPLTALLRWAASFVNGSNQQETSVEKASTAAVAASLELERVVEGLARKATGGRGISFTDLHSEEFIRIRVMLKSLRLRDCDHSVLYSAESVVQELKLLADIYDHYAWVCVDFVGNVCTNWCTVAFS